MRGPTADWVRTGRAALSLLHNGILGDTYALPTGPTAHVSPMHTAYLAAVFHLFGDNTTLARKVLSQVSLALWLGSAWLALRIGEILQLGRVGIWVIVACISLFPFYLPAAVVYCRQWDQPFAAFLLACFLFVVLRGDASRLYGWVAAAAALAGLGGLFSPSLLPSLLIGLAYVVPPLRQTRRAAAAGLLGIAILAAFLLPWGVRNSRELGIFTVTRSNFGLELAVGNNDEAAGAPAMAGQIHPYESLDAARLVAELGEVAFMRRMQDQAIGWIGEHPRRFAKLVVTRGVLILLPFNTLGEWQPLLPTALVAAGLLLYGLAKIGATLVLLLRGPRRFLWLTYTMLPLAPYALTHVSSRYAFVVFFPTVCLIGLVADRWAQARRPGPRAAT